MKKHTMRDMFDFHMQYTTQLAAICVERLREEPNHASAKKLYNLSIETQRIEYRKFSKMAFTFFKAITNSLIETGVSFNLGGSMGGIHIVAKERKPRTNKVTGAEVYPVNWGESNKVKAAIIERGGIPYHKDTAPDGEQWLVYHTSGWNPYIVWKAGSVLHPIKKKVVPRFPYITYLPSSGEDSLLDRLYTHRRNNPNIIHKYEKYYSNVAHTTDTVGSNNQ